MANPKPKRTAGHNTSGKKKKAPKVSRISAPLPTETFVPQKTRSELKAEAKATVLSRPKLPSAWSIARRSLGLLWSRRWLFLGITAVYASLSVLLVRGFAGGTEIAELKNVFSGNFQGFMGQIATGLLLFTSLVSATGGPASQAANGYQTLLVIMVSLAVVWSLRRIIAGDRVRIRDAYYEGMYPLVPVVLVLLVVILQMLPLLIGGTLYSVIVSTGLASTLIEKILWGGLFGLAASLTIYMLCSSLFAAYIATLPHMAPLEALRTARNLVRYRRWPLLRKLVFLPVALLLTGAVIMVPILLWATPLAPWVFYPLSMLSIPVIHTYMYLLYRELLA